MPNLLAKGDAIKDLLRSLAANTAEAQEFKQVMGAVNPTTPTVPDYTPAAMKAMILDLLNNDPDIVLAVRSI